MAGESDSDTYEVDVDVLTIWMGGRDSPAYVRGAFTEDGDSCAGDWIYPGGGGWLG